MATPGRLVAVADDQLSMFEAEFDRFETAWQTGSPPDIEQFISNVSSRGELSDSVRRQRFLAELVAIDLERRWRSTTDGTKTTVANTSHNNLPEKPRLEDYLARFPVLASSGHLPLDLVAQEYRARVLWGDNPQIAEYVARFPAQADAVRGELERIDREIAAGGLSRHDAKRQSRSDVALARHVAATVDSHDQPRGRVEPPPLPSHIGRFEVLDVLGSGGFGVVYRARDPQLNREVAIKVPRPDCVAALGGAAAFLREARTIASLDHPGIVPVYEAGRTDDGLCYVVAKLMPGGNLAQLIATSRPSVDRAAQLVTRIAEALHHAHQHGLVHRDIKPANILLDADGRPQIVDFGLAMHEEDFGSGPAFVGTLAYMSPEQARDTGHLVDARSDIFSLGLVLFELLSGKSPYRGKSKQQLVEEITSCDPRPIRQLDTVVPAELDRICQKARAMRPADRYATAQDLADDLRAFLRQRAAKPKPRWRLPLALAAVAALAVAAIAVGLNAVRESGSVSQSGTQGTTAAALNAPIITLGHPNSRGWLAEVGRSDMPLPAGDAVNVEVALSKGEEGYLYLFQFDEGQRPQRLWPEVLANQRKVSSVSYPKEHEAIPLDGDPRRMMFVAAVSPTPLAESDLAKIESVAFSFEKVTAGEPICKLYHPKAPPMPEKRGPTRADEPRVVTIEKGWLKSDPGIELQHHFQAFSAVVFSYQATEPK